MAVLRDSLSKGREVPPNLRRGNARYRCGLCAFFSRGECVKFGVRVAPTQLSDSFKPKEGGPK